MSALLFALGLVVLVEALNKLERSGPCAIAPGKHTRERVLAWLKAVAWLLLALGGAGALAGPFVGFGPPTLRELAMFGGTCLLIVRTRIKEG